jgi:hypothetical protein
MSKSNKKWRCIASKYGKEFIVGKIYITSEGGHLVDEDGDFRNTPIEYTRSKNNYFKFEPVRSNPTIGGKLIKDT